MKVPPLAFPHPDKVLFDRSPGAVAGCDWSLDCLERVAVGFAGSNPQRMIDRHHKDLAVADLSGTGAGSNDLDSLVGDIGRNGDFDPQLREKIHDVLCAAINLRVALLAAVTLDLGHGHAVNADGGQRLADLVKLERFDNGDNELHVQAFISRDSESRSSLDLHPHKSGIFLPQWHKKLAA